MRREVWLTNRVYGTWVPAPAINYQAGAQGWSHQMNYLDGGASVRSSNGSHREFNMSWNLASQAELMPIQGFASGMYGDSLLYWSDPFAQQFNIVQKDWATPQLGGTDGVILTGTTRPALNNGDINLTNQYGLPYQRAVYTNVVTANSKQLWIPIPPGFKLVIEAYGTASGTVAYGVTPDGGSVTNLPWRTAPGAAPNAFQGVPGVTLALTGSGTNSASIAGIQAVIIPIERATVPFTTFNMGTGHSGLRFAQMPQVSYYSAVMDGTSIGMSVNLVEVGAWQ